MAANLCSIIDGYSRHNVAYRLSEDGAALDVALVFQMAIKSFPLVRGRGISDNGKAFASKEFRELLGLHGFIFYSNTSPYYPQANGKQVRFHGTLKHELIVVKTMPDYAYATRRIDGAIDYYNNVRLHSAIGYVNVTPRDLLEGRVPAIQAGRERKFQEARERRRRLAKPEEDAT